MKPTAILVCLNLIVWLAELDSQLSMVHVLLNLTALLFNSAMKTLVLLHAPLEPSIRTEYAQEAAQRQRITMHDSVIVIVQQQHQT